MRRAAPTANFPAAGGRRPAGPGETRCVALEKIQFHLARGRLLSGTGLLGVIFGFIRWNILQIFAPPGETRHWEVTARVTVQKDFLSVF
jgi:hypothetical protein